jgi:Antitoxin-like ribbon-helix-helix
MLLRGNEFAHLEPELGKQLRQIAAEKGITAKALMGEALGPNR